MKTEKFELDDRFGVEFAGKYCFGEITWAKRNRIVQKYTKYSKLSGEVESSDFIAIQAETIMASLHGQPDSRPITLEKILGESDGIPNELGELLSKVCNKLNGLSHGDIRFLLEQLSEVDRTQLLQSLGYAKSSDGSQLTLPVSQPEKSKNLSPS
jgi:hypothetical protein